MGRVYYANVAKPVAREKPEWVDENLLSDSDMAILKPHSINGILFCVQQSLK
jgi:hypothetical protein